MATSNRDRIGKNLELLNDGLRPFVQRELTATFKDRWLDSVRYGMKEQAHATVPDEVGDWDSTLLLTVMQNHWSDTFRRTLGHAERALITELRTIRNDWAHQKPFTSDDTYRALDSIGRLLGAVSAKEADAVEKEKQELLRLRYDEQVKSERRKSAGTSIEGQPIAALKAWRDVVTPHEDVASGRYQQAEFAADLWQVYTGEGVVEYKNPTEFFRRTYLTAGLSQLLVGALKRMAGTGGDPVIELQTNFGGGKTHSMLGLFHLFSGTPSASLPGMDDVFVQAEVKEAPKQVRRAVIVGNKISPGQPLKKSDGTVIRTLWGELAWQLGFSAGGASEARKAFEMLRESDETSTNPGDILRDVFNRYSPCLILIDEWVAYARQLHDANDLPGGSFETHFTFAQTLSEAAKAAKQTLLVVSIPASETNPHTTNAYNDVSDVEVGGQRGRDALERLKNAIGRVESPWRPASAEEGFEIVRRRLFKPISDPALFKARDTVARAYAELYQSQAQEFPADCTDYRYEDRIKAAYPIHPELFDRLYNDWSSLVKFQRTRGVLRLMASVIHSLWERNDKSLLIMPACVPVDDPAVQFELTRYLEDQWVPVLEKDIDGSNSLPLKLDRENPNFGRYSATRRVARTLYLGSAPTLRATNKGLDDRQIKLGCVQPGETVATFGDALRRLNGQATYLYEDGKRYWFSTQPSVNRLAESKAAQLSDDDVMEEIRRRLRDLAGAKGDFTRVHACPGGSVDIPDEQPIRLVILGPETAHGTKDPSSAARDQAAKILSTRGSSPRQYANALVFLAADRTRLQELAQAVRQQLAWRSIDESHDELNLDAFQSRQAKTKHKAAEDTVKLRIPETYVWLLVPSQAVGSSEITWNDLKLQGQDDLAQRASKKLKSEGLLYATLGASSLRLELDKVPLWRGEHVAIKQLVEDFARYLYLPRLRSPDVLEEAVREGVSLLTWVTDGFAYADSWDEVSKRYRGLRTGVGFHVSIEGDGVLVKPSIATVQFSAEKPVTADPKSPAPSTSSPAAAGGNITVGGGVASGAHVNPPAPAKPTRYYGTVEIDPARVNRDVGNLSKELIEHLVALVGADVKVTLEIQAELPGGFPDGVIRTVSENSKVLRVKGGFEEA